MTTGAIQITEYTVARGETRLKMSRRIWGDYPDREFWLIQAVGYGAQVEGYDAALVLAEALATKMEQARVLRETAAQIETEVGQALRAIPFPPAP